MNTHFRPDLAEWLQQSAHAKPGHPFHMGDRSCLPFLRENLDTSENDENTPLGFLVTTGHDVEFVVDDGEDQWEMLTLEWNKQRFILDFDEAEGLPSECWYG